jgi:hypothetical protein
MMPLVYLLLKLIFPPTYFTFLYFIMIKRLDMSIKDLALIDNFSAIIYFFLFMWCLNKMKNVPLWKLCIIANFAKIAELFQVQVFYPELPRWVYYVVRGLYQIVSSFAFDLQAFPLFALVSKHLPEGFESTGLVLIISMINFCNIISGHLGAH